jgi:cytochrome P450
MNKARRPPGPKGRLLLGHLPEIAGERQVFYAHCARQYGDCAVLWHGWLPIWLLNHPDLIRQVLVTEVHKFQKDWRYCILGRLFGNGLVTSSGELWLRQRRLMQPAFASRQITSYGADMVTLTRANTDSWVDGEVRDVHADMARLTMAILVKTIFGMELRGRAEAVVEAYADAFRCIERLMVSLWPLPPWVPTPTNLRLRRQAARLDKLLYELITERRQKEDGGDLLSVLIRTRDEEGGTGMTDLQVRDEVMTLLSAGHDTVALALTYAMYLLAEHPNASLALREELDTVLAGRLPTVADLPRLVRTEHFVREVLRLYPPIPSLTRIAVAATELGGYPLPAGTNVVMNPWVTHRDPRWFEEPEQFRPERWANGLAERLPRFAFFPFGGGTRGCIGRDFSMMEIILALATIAQRYHFTRSDGPGWRIVPSLTLKPSGPVKLRVSCVRPNAGEDNQAASQLPQSSVVPAETCPVQRGAP